MKLLLLSTILIGLAIAGIAIKMFFIRGSQFTKSCSSVDVDADGRRVGCSCSGDGSDDRSCENYEKHHGKG